MITNPISLDQRFTGATKLNTFWKSILYLVYLRITFIRPNCALSHCKGRIWPSWTFRKSEGREINCHIFRQSRHVIYMSRPRNCLNELRWKTGCIRNENPLMCLLESLFIALPHEKAQWQKDSWKQGCDWPHAKYKSEHRFPW